MTIDQSLNEVLDDYVAGNLTLPELFDDFKARNWGAPSMSHEALMLNEDHIAPENDWAVVEAYRQDNDLTADEYDYLVNRMVSARNAEQETELGNKDLEEPS